MEARHFEDWKVGDRLETLGRTVGDAEISQFVALGGFFEELFISAEYIAKGSLYPKRFAPGALIFAFTEGLIIRGGSGLITAGALKTKAFWLSSFTIPLRLWLNCGIAITAGSSAW